MTVDPNDRSIGWPQRHPVFKAIDSNTSQIISTVSRWESTSLSQIKAATGLDDALIAEALTDMLRLGSIGKDDQGYHCWDYYDPERGRTFLTTET